MTIQMEVQIFMAQHKVVVKWERGGVAFLHGKYSRGHKWMFDGGAEVLASSSPHVVPPPMSIETAVDPEEAFVASLSSCHMLSFLYVAWKRGFVVDGYRDEAVGVLEKDADGGFSMTRVTLNPLVCFGGEKKPSSEDIDSMHHEAHTECFIARSVKTDVRVAMNSKVSV
jgi:organic hydroperoxide reductase OsmC/OhrA